jgi:hypothetical protein
MEFIAAINLMSNKKTLAESNPYLRDPEMRKRSLFISAASSSAVEGIHAPFKKMARELRIDWPPKRTLPQAASTLNQPLAVRKSQ